METVARTRTLPKAIRPLEAAPGGTDEREVVARCLAGDETAAETLVAAHNTMVYGIGLRLTGRAEDAEDLAQEVFLRVFRSLREFRGECSLRSWIAAIAVNQARNRIGSLVRFRKTFTTADAAADDPEDDPISRVPDPDTEGPLGRLLEEERTRLVAGAIDELPREFREAVVLRDQQGLSYEEIASSTGVPVGTVRSRLARGRGILARRLRGVLGPPSDSSPGMKAGAP